MLMVHRLGQLGVGRLTLNAVLVVAAQKRRLVVLLLGNQKLLLMLLMLLELIVRREGPLAVGRGRRRQLLDHLVGHDWSHHRRGIAGVVLLPIRGQVGEAHEGAVVVRALHLLRKGQRSLQISESVAGVVLLPIRGQVGEAHEGAVVVRALHLLRKGQRSLQISESVALQAAASVVRSGSHQHLLEVVVDGGRVVVGGDLVIEIRRPVSEYKRGFITHDQVESKQQGILSPVFLF